MKEADIICMKLDQAGEKIISRKQIIKIIRSVGHDKTTIILRNLRKIKKIKYLFLNHYYILSENEIKYKIINYYSPELVFGVLNRLNIKWYITFEKALELNNVVWQSYRKFIIINNKISKRITILNTEFEFKKTKVVLINNYVQNKTKNRITQNIGSNEKVFVDFMYFKRTIPKELRKIIDKNKVKTILKEYNTNFQKKVIRELI